MNHLSESWRTPKQRKSFENSCYSCGDAGIDFDDFNGVEQLCKQCDADYQTSLFYLVNCAGSLSDIGKLRDGRIDFYVKWNEIPGWAQSGFDAYRMSDIDDTIILQAERWAGQFRGWLVIFANEDEMKNPNI